MFRTLLTLAGAGALAAACAQLPAPGTPRDGVLAQWGPPTARHALPAGAERLEYATGPFGRVTWMVDMGADGRVSAVNQVLNEAHFAVFAEKAPGMPRAEVLRTLGTPGEVQRVRHPPGELWSWRYPTNDCLWFQVAIGTDGRAINAGYNIDWRCDQKDGARF